MSTSSRAYHHGDLRAALVASAIEMLEEGEAYSVRAVARRAGVSPAAPYRHFPDRAALDSAVAVEGFAELRTALSLPLERTSDTARPADVLAELGIAYVGFALRRPTLFRLMFGNEPDDADSDRVQAAQSMHAVLGEAITQLFPGRETPGLAMALWSLAHGLAFLHLDGKYRPEPADDVAARVRSSVDALFALSI